MLQTEPTSPDGLQEEETGRNLQGKCLAFLCAGPLLLLLITGLTVTVLALSVALAVKKLEAVIMSPVYSACPKNWIGFGSECFYFSEEQRNWTHSQAFCMALGAELARFKNLEELKFLMRYKGASAHWIGLSKESSGHPWKWTDGTEYNMMDVHGEGTRAYLSSDRISSSRDGPPRNWICHKPSSSDLQCPKLSPSA